MLRRFIVNPINSKIEKPVEPDRSNRTAVDPETDGEIMDEVERVPSIRVQQISITTGVLKSTIHGVPTQEAAVPYISRSAGTSTFVHRLSY